jgi:hypothetical protein
MELSSWAVLPSFLALGSVIVELLSYARPGRARVLARLEKYSLLGRSRWVLTEPAGTSDFFSR